MPCGFFVEQLLFRSDAMRGTISVCFSQALSTGKFEVGANPRDTVVTAKLADALERASSLKFAQIRRFQPVIELIWTARGILALRQSIREGNWAAVSSMTMQMTREMAHRTSPSTVDSCC